MPFAIFSRIVRLVALALLFGGSSAVVFAAITLVKAATAAGVPVSEAATANAPIFIQFSKIALGAGIGLLLAECLDFAMEKKPAKLTLARYAASLACVASTMVFAFVIVPPMESLLPSIKSDKRAHEKFHKMHETSRGVFAATILFALLALILPAFEKPALSPPAGENA